MIVAGSYFNLGGGKERKATEQRQLELSQRQQALAEQQFTQAQKEMESRKALQQPSVDFYSRMTSANPSERLRAAAVPIGDTAKLAAGAKESIYENAPRGAARDFALAQVPRDQYAQIAEMLNKAYLGAFPAMASIGTEAGQVGLQQTGAGMRGVEGAVNTNAQIMENQARQYAARLGLFGSIASAATSAVTSGLSGGFKLPSFMQSSASRFSAPMGQATGLPK
jgi:hypothetical protein